MNAFNELVQALPPEIYNTIYDFTFTATSNVVYVDEAYGPPALLAVNRSTREKFKASYYSQDMIFSVDRKVFSTWIVAVASSGIKSEIRMAKKPFRASNALTAFGFAEEVFDELKRQRIRTRHIVNRFWDQLRFELVFGKPEKKAWCDSRIWMTLGRSGRVQRSGAS